MNIINYSPTGMQAVFIDTFPHPADTARLVAHDGTHADAGVNRTFFFITSGSAVLCTV